MCSDVHNQSQVAGFLPPLAFTNGVCLTFTVVVSLIRTSQVLPNMSIPESALTETWPIQENNDLPGVSTNV